MLNGYVLKRTRFRKTVELAVGSTNFLGNGICSGKKQMFKFCGVPRICGFVDRLIKKYSAERDFNYCFSRKSINDLMID